MFRLLTRILLVVAVPTVALAASTIDPAVLRYFAEPVVRRHDDFVLPLRWNWAIQQVAYLVFVAVFLGFQLNRRLRVRCEAVAAGWTRRAAGVPVLRVVAAAMTRAWKDETWGGALLFAMGYLLIQVAIALPSDFYFGWYYERAHGTSVEPLTRWLWDALKALLTEALALSALAFGLYGLARRMKHWWLVLGVPCALLMLLIAGLFDPLRVQLYFKHEPLPEGPHKQAIVATLKKAGVEYEGIFQQKMSDVTRRTNAAFMGDGPTRRIVVWDTVIHAMTPDEVANVVAHEAGHLKDKSPSRILFASLALLPVLAMLAFVLRRLGRSGRLGFDGDHDVASLPMAFFLVWLLEFAAGPVSNAYSRDLERKADRYALELLEQPDAFRSMMVKVVRTNLADCHPPAWVRVLLHGHPPVMERIGAAEAFARERSLALPEATPERFSIPDASDPLKAPLGKR